jgi:hypothetical protein
MSAAVTHRGLTTPDTCGRCAWAHSCCESVRSRPWEPLVGARAALASCRRRGAHQGSCRGHTRARGLPGRAMLEIRTEGVTVVRQSERWAPLAGIMFVLRSVVRTPEGGTGSLSNVFDGRAG